LVHISSPFVGDSAFNDVADSICLIKKDFPVFDGPNIDTKAMGAWRERIKATAYACSTILPKELMEISCINLVEYVYLYMFKY
jgi:hypothetical protein